MIARTITSLLVPAPSILHETAVDLDLVEAERQQLRHGGVAGAEIVERDAHAGRPQFVDDVLRRIGIPDDRAFSDFKLQPGRRQTGLAQNAQNAQAQGGVAQLQRRNVE